MKSSYKIKLILKPDQEKQKLMDKIKSIDLKCFPNDHKITDSWIKDCYWWFMFIDSRVVGYCAMRFIYRSGRKVAYFTRVGILKSHRGRGLQKRLIRARLNYAKRNNAARVVTYTLCDNCASSNNLIKCGFKTYNPIEQWAGRDVIYWRIKGVKNE